MHTHMHTYIHTVLTKLSQALSSALRKGSVVATVNKCLDTSFGFKLVKKLLGPNPDSVTEKAVTYVYTFEGV